jgi:hypothetical protein
MMAELAAVAALGQLDLMPLQTLVAPADLDTTSSISITHPSALLVAAVALASILEALRLTEAATAQAAT